MWITKKEAISIIAVSIILGFIISLIETLSIFLIALLTIFLVIIINVAAKKFISYYFEAETEVELWEIIHYLPWIFGFKKPRKFKKPFPAGAFIPIIIKIISFGYLNWLACLVFEVKPKVYRAAKRHGLYKFSEMTEYHLALIAAAGIAANLVFAIIGYLIGVPLFTKLNLYYAFWNMLPISSLDGNKIFFGSLTLWIFLVCIVLVGLFFGIFIV